MFVVLSEKKDQNQDARKIWKRIKRIELKRFGGLKLIL